MKKKIMAGLSFLFALLFILMPLPASDLIIRIYFDDIAGDSCALYYSTDAGKNIFQENCIVSEIDYGQKRVEFRLDGALEGQITALRLDWPQWAEEQLICIKNISVCSGGVIQKEYNPCYFFADGNIGYSHDIALSLVQIRDRAYLRTGTDDPYQMLSDALTEEIVSHYSHRIFSRIFLCVFISGCWLLARRKLFS